MADDLPAGVPWQESGDPAGFSSSAHDLGARMWAVALLLTDSGDLTPYGARVIRRAIRQHLPDVTFEGADED